MSGQSRQSKCEAKKILTLDLPLGSSAVLEMDRVPDGRAVCTAEDGVQPRT